MHWIMSFGIAVSKDYGTPVFQPLVGRIVTPTSIPEDLGVTAKDQEVPKMTQQMTLNRNPLEYHHAGGETHQGGNHRQMRIDLHPPGEVAEPTYLKTLEE